VGNVYVKCLVKPKECDPMNAKMPTFKICFSDVGCLTAPEIPNPNQFGDWLKTNVLGKIKSWFENLITWGSFSLKIPNCNPNCFSTEEKDFTWPKPSLTHGNVWSPFGEFHVPNGITTTDTHWATITVPNGVKKKDVGMDYPNGINISGAKSKSSTAATQAAADKTARTNAEAAQKTTVKNRAKELEDADAAFQNQQALEAKRAEKATAAATARGEAAKKAAEDSKEAVGKAMDKKQVLPDPFASNDAAFETAGGR
jgi:hypothetical protein